MNDRFKITITGRADPLFLAALIEDVKNLTPIGGGFSFEYGTHAESDEQGWPGGA